MKEELNDTKKEMKDMRKELKDTEDELKDTKEELAKATSSCPGEGIYSVPGIHIVYSVMLPLTIIKRVGTEYQKSMSILSLRKPLDWTKIMYEMYIVKIIHKANPKNAIQNSQQLQYR